MVVYEKGMGSLMENADPTPSNPIVPKSESVQDGYTSSSVSTPEADIGPITQDVVQVQKRKGGRKPVHLMNLVNVMSMKAESVARYMPRQRSASRGTGRPKLLFESGEPNTSNSLKTPSSTTRMPCRTYSKVIVVPQTSV